VRQEHSLSLRLAVAEFRRAGYSKSTSDGNAAQGGGKAARGRARDPVRKTAGVARGRGQCPNEQVTKASLQEGAKMLDCDEFPTAEPSTS
jgi:hypothetical protein